MSTEPEGNVDGPRTLRDVFNEAQAAGIPSKVWPGMTLDWNSEYVEVELYAELPFWLMMPNVDLNVKHKESELNVSVIGNGIEIQSGRLFLKSRANVLHFEEVSTTPSEKANAAMRSTNNDFILRHTQTLLKIKTRALTDSVKAMSEKARRRVDAYMYFHSFVEAHLPFINHLVNAYRKTAGDPFAMEVSAWDIPVWFICADNKIHRISLIPYAEYDAFPQILPSIDATESEPIFLSSKDEVQNALNAGELPGDVELLDAWALYYRGRFGDAIRSLVTAIEVVLESELKRALKKIGLSEEEIDKRLELTFNNFEERLTDYLRITKRRMPGPLLSWIYYINGIRLREELEATRHLRHKIVHEGLRLDYALQGSVSRAMDTMSWLFNWFRTDSPIPMTDTIKHSALKSGMIGRGNSLRFHFHYTPAGVVVEESHFPEDGPISDEVIAQQLIDSIDERPDMELFATMCLKKLDYELRETAPHDNDAFFELCERYVAYAGDSVMPIFLIETSEFCSASIVSKIAVRVLVLSQRGLACTGALCIVNHQNGLAWKLRTIDEAIPDDVSKMAAESGITLVSAVDMLLLALAMDTYPEWTPAIIRYSLNEPGRQAINPPRSKLIGTVYHFYERPRVVSIAIEPGQRVCIGDMIVIRLRGRYFRQRIESMQLNQNTVNEAIGPVRIGIQIELHRGDVPIGAKVFIEDEQSTLAG